MFRVLNIVNYKYKHNNIIMSEDVKAVHREPHPFVGIQHLSHFIGKTVAFVGKIDRVEDNTLYMKTSDGKSIIVHYVWMLIKLRYYSLTYLLCLYLLFNSLY